MNNQTQEEKHSFSKLKIIWKIQFFVNFLQEHDMKNYEPLPKLIQLINSDYLVQNNDAWKVKLVEQVARHFRFRHRKTRSNNPLSRNV